MSRWEGINAMHFEELLRERTWLEAAIYAFIAHVLKAHHDTAKLHRALLKLKVKTAKVHKWIDWVLGVEHETLANVVGIGMLASFVALDFLIGASQVSLATDLIRFGVSFVAVRLYSDYA